MAESLYTDDIRNYLHTRDWPKGLVFEITENETPEPHLNIIFFRDNWLTLTFDDHLKIASITKEVMSKVWSDGIPIYVGKMESQYDEH